MSNRILTGLSILVVFGCNGPFAVLPGGQLTGDVSAAPSDWGFAGDYGTMQLETHPEEPYSVNIAYTVIGGRVYINAGDTETQWVKNMDENPKIRMRLDGAVYELRAERVSDSAEISAFAKAWTDQSMFRRDPTELEQVWIYRLVSR